MRSALILLLCASAWTAEWVPMEVNASGYCPGVCCCGSRAAGVTADNTKVKDEPYGVASDPRVLPYGTSVWIPPHIGYLDKSRASDREFLVDDTGGYLRTQTRRTGVVHIDLRFKYHSSAKRFGRKNITIWKWVE